LVPPVDHITATIAWDLLEGPVIIDVLTRAPEVLVAVDNAAIAVDLCNCDPLAINPDDLHNGEVNDLVAVRHEANSEFVARLGKSDRYGDLFIANMGRRRLVSALLGYDGHVGKAVLLGASFFFAQLHASRLVPFCRPQRIPGCSSM
jgi:hypothetical protein